MRAYMLLNDTFMYGLKKTNINFKINNYINTKFVEILHNCFLLSELN